jgi:surfactin synthase thioesterase subunit
VGAAVRAAALRLLCFHHAGGGASLYRGWQRGLGPHVAVLPVLLPGRERRRAEPRFTVLDAQVADLDTQLDEILGEPHVLFGHSMGALIAYRLACRRRASGRPLPRALLLSSYPAPHLGAPMAHVDERDADALMRMLSGIGGLPSALLEWPGGADEFVAVARDDLRMCASNGDRCEAPLPCPLHVFGSDADPLVAEQDLWEWDRCSEYPVEVEVLAGGHFHIRDRPEQLWERLRPLLRHYA